MLSQFLLVETMRTIREDGGVVHDGRFAVRTNKGRDIPFDPFFALLDLGWMQFDREVYDGTFYTMVYKDAYPDVPL